MSTASFCRRACCGSPFQLVNTKRYSPFSVEQIIVCVDKERAFAYFGKRNDLPQAFAAVWFRLRDGDFPIFLCIAVPLVVLHPVGDCF
jgi:hypothetical protein